MTLVGDDRSSAMFSSAIDVEVPGLFEGCCERSRLSRRDKGGGGATRTRGAEAAGDPDRISAGLGKAVLEVSVRESGEWEVGGGGKGLLRSVGDRGDFVVGDAGGASSN